MMKFIPLFLSLMIPFSGALADQFDDQALQLCRNHGGKYEMEPMQLVGDKYCRQVTCKRTTVEGKYEIKPGDKGPEANVEITKPVCVAKSVIDGSFDGSGGIDVNGDGKVDSKDDINGDGVIDGKDLEEWRRKNPGSNNGNNNGNNGTPGGEGDDYCEFALSKTIPSNHPCAKKCRKNLWGKEGIERRACRNCIEKYATENGGDVLVDWSTIPGGKPNKSSVEIKGVSVKTGEIICYDSKGNIVSRTTSGSLCPSGSSTHSGGVVINPGTTSGGNGGVVVSGGVSGGVQLPSFCQSNKRKDKTACENWMRANARFACSSSSNPSGCMGSDYADIQSRYNYDGCVNCAGGRGRGRDNSWLGDALGGLFLGAGSAVGAYFNGQAYIKGQEAWAGAAAAGFEQCQIHNNNYLQYLQANELPSMSPSQQAAMGCNGFGLNQYGGMGAGGMGAWNGSGYSNGFLGGMMGPYGGYNPYGMGGVVGGAVGGISGGYAGGYPGGIAGGYVGGYPGGIAGGIAGGYPGGMAGGYVGGYPGGIAGGMVNGAVNGGGYPGGYVAGGYVAGGAGGYPGGYAGGYAGGYPGGIAGGGLVNGVSIAGGVAGGYPGGYAGGYAAGGYAGGFNGGYNGGGYVNGGYMAGGIAGGYNGGGGYGPGGWGSGTGQWGGGGYYGGQGNYWAASQQTSSYDQMLQGQGVSYQMGMNSGAGGYGGYGGYGSAGYNPMNVGATFGAGVNLGGGFGGYGGF